MRNLSLRKCIGIIALLWLASNFVFAQQQKVDSFKAILLTARNDSNKAKILWQTADAMYMYNPDSALQYAGQALLLSKQLHFLRGQSKSLGIIANILNRMGNYPKALDYLLQNLKIEEERKNPKGIAGAQINIGIVYVYLEDYKEALNYYRQADSIIEQHHLDDIRYNSALNLGDVYDKLGQHDSAFYYFAKSLGLANQMQDKDYVGTSLLGLGNVYFQQNAYTAAVDKYRNSVAFLTEVKDEDLLCEAALGLAKTYKALKRFDSSTYFANLSLYYATKDGFLSRELDASAFLYEHFDGQTKDSAYKYLKLSTAIKDSLESKDKIAASQRITFNEQLRQLELAEKEANEKEERRQQLQLILIGLFIPTLFLITLLLTRSKIPLSMIKFLGVISLLFFFEYLTLLLHPKVVEITHHTPIFEILIFVAIAGLLIPLHHKIEHYVVKLLLNRASKHRPVKSEQENEQPPVADENPGHEVHMQPSAMPKTTGKLSHKHKKKALQVKPKKKSK